MFSSETWFAKTGADFYNGATSKSARFRQPDSSYLSKNFSSDGNTKTMTFSWWFKKGQSSQGTYNIGEFFNHGQSGAGGSQSSARITLESDKLNIAHEDNNSTSWELISNNLFRDSTNWYHFVVAFDTTQSTNTNRVKAYVNGTELTYSTASYPSQNADLRFGQDEQYIGVSIGSGVPWSLTYLDGYMCDINFVDGTALTPTSFGETKEGIWIPIEPSVTYGTNGYRLEFKQTGTGTASASTIGADTSGNTNHWTSNNFASNDSNLLDHPENNFATINPLIKSGNTFSEGNLKVTTTTSTPAKFVSTIGVTSGKWFMEFRHSGDANYPFGITSDPHERDYLGISDGSTSVAIWGGSSSSNAFVNGSIVSWGGSGTTWSAGDIIGLALNADDSILEVYKNGSSIGSYDYSGLNWSDHFFAGGNYVAATFSANFGQDSTFQGAISAGGNADAKGRGNFKYSVPTGFLALCSANLPEPTISPNADTQADDYFNSVIWNGNGSSNAITGVGHKPDLIWSKDRNGTESHVVLDSIRGNTHRLYADSAGAQTSDSSVTLTSFDADGFTLTQYHDSNQSGSTNVGWCWKAGGDIADVSGNFIKDGVAFTPTQGTINATSISVNTTSKFSIVKFTSDISSDVGETGTPPTIAHGIGVKPTLVIVKDTDGGAYPHWNVWHQGYQPDATYLNYQLFLEVDTASNNAGWHRTDSGFTTNLFTPPRYQYNETGKTYICYVFAEVEGYSKFGTYKGNGSTDGTFIYTGFTPRWIMVKRADSADNWAIYDSARDTFNVRDSYLLADLSNQEATYSTAIVDFLSNGFKWRGAVNFGNNSSGTYIYMAFATVPFKYSNAI